MTSVSRAAHVCAAANLRDATHGLVSSKPRPEEWLQVDMYPSVDVRVERANDASDRDVDEQRRGLADERVDPVVAPQTRRSYHDELLDALQE